MTSCVVDFRNRITAKISSSPPSDYPRRRASRRVCCIVWLGAQERCENVQQVARYSALQYLRLPCQQQLVGNVLRLA